VVAAVSDHSDRQNGRKVGRELLGQFGSVRNVQTHTADDDVDSEGANTIGGFGGGGGVLLPKYYGPCPPDETVRAS